MKYTEKFWAISQDRRSEEWRVRLKRGEFLKNFKQLGYINRDGYLVTEKETKPFKEEHHPRSLKIEKTLPTSHDSDYVASYIINKELTQYCYIWGLNPKEIQFISEDKRIPTTQTKRYGWFGLKKREETIVMQHITIYILQTPGTP